MPQLRGRFNPGARWSPMRTWGRCALEPGAQGGDAPLSPCAVEHPERASPGASAARSAAVSSSVRPLLRRSTRTSSSGPMDKLRLCTESTTGGKGGGVLVRHRFGSSLNLHMHAHVRRMDGACAENKDGNLDFVPACAPTQMEVEHVATRLRQRLRVLSSGAAWTSMSP